MATFRKPYNTDYVGLYEKARQYHEEGYRQNAAAQMANAQRDDETWQKLAQFSKTAGGWAEEIKEKNEIAEAANEKLQTFFNQIYNNVDYSELIKAKEQDDIVKNVINRDDQKILKRNVEQGFSYEAGLNNRINNGIFPATHLAPVYLEAAWNNTLPGLMDELNDPNKVWYVEGRPDGFKLDENASSAEWHAAYAQQIDKLMKHPDIARSSSTDVLPYITQLSKSYDKFKRAVQTQVDYQKGEKIIDATYRKELLAKDGGGIAAAVEEIAISHDENGKPRGFAGAMDVVSERLLSAIDNAPLDGDEGEAAYKRLQRLINQKIPEGYKGAGKKYSEEYPNRFGAGSEFLRDAQEKLNSWRTKSKKFKIGQGAQLLKTKSDELRSKGLTGQEIQIEALKIKKEILEGKYGDYIDFTDFDNEFTSEGRKTLYSDEQVGNVRNTLDSLVETAKLDLKLHDHLIRILPLSEQNKYRTFATQLSESRKGNEYEKARTNLRTLTAPEKWQFTQDPTHDMNEVDSIFLMKHWQLARAKPDASAFELVQEAERYAEEYYKKNLQPTIVTTIDGQGNVVEKSIPGRYQPLDSRQAKEYGITQGETLASRRAAPVELTDHEKLINIERIQLKQALLYGNKLLTEPGLFFKKEETAAWDVLDIHPASGNSYNEIKSAAKLAGMPVPQFVNHMRVLNGQEPFENLPEIVTSKASKALSKNPNFTNSCKYIQYARTQGNQDPYDFMPQWWRQFPGIDTFDKEDHGLVCAIAERGGLLSRFDSKEDIPALKRVLEIFEEYPQLIKEKLGKELYFKWLAKEDEPLTDLLRPSLQPKQ